MKITLGEGPSYEQARHPTWGTLSRRTVNKARMLFLVEVLQNQKVELQRMRIYSERR